jgi:hypothetical protein
VVRRRHRDPTGEGKLQLDSVLDMGSRRIVGFALGEHHDTGLAYGALAMAVAVDYYRFRRHHIQWHYP